MHKPIAISVSFHTERWELATPFRIAGYSWKHYEVNVVELSDGDFVGRGESTPVHNLDETAESAARQIETAVSKIEGGIDRQSLREVMPPGSGRSAVDCALWDLEAKRTGKRIWELTGIRAAPQPTAYTIGLGGSAQEAVASAVEASKYPILKVKVDGDRPVERVAAIRAARKNARITVDANQSWTFDELARFAPALRDLEVRLIEQPLARDGDEQLETYASPVPLCADESCQHLGDLDIAVRRYQIINVKLDKAGGLTEALLLAREVKANGRELLVSCMGGTSLGMAQGVVVAQLADYVELDGHTLLKRDRPHGLHINDGYLTLPTERLWG